MARVPKPVRHRGKWRIRWVDDRGVRHSEVFEERREAEYRVRQQKLIVDEIRRGLRTPLPPERTFGQLCDYWLENRAKQKRSGYHDESIIRRHLRPSFGTRQIAQVGVEVVDRFVAERRHLDPKTIANLLTLLISMLNAAHDLGWLHKVPRIRKPKIKLLSKDFRYLRTDEEIQRFLTAAHAHGEVAFNLYATAIYTGMRAGELAGLRWGDIDFAQRLITVQRSFDGPTKSDEVRYVPILDPLLTALRAWRLRCPSSIVFPNRDGRPLGKSARLFQGDRVLDAAGFPTIERRGKVRRYIVFHDLRHTFASSWVRASGDIFKLQKILGHQDIKMTLRYAHLAPAAYAADYARLSSIPTPTSQVIPIHRR